MAKILAILKQQTNKMFLPVSLQGSPLDPDSELMILLRPIQQIEAFIYNESLSMDENVIAKRFQIKAFQFMASDPQKRKEQLLQDLTNLHRNDGLVLIGGV